MTDTALTRLKVIVERAVRPVPALSRKRKMREELLAHVTSVFEEESARGVGEDEALAAAERRFGDPRDVALGLEAATPAYERFLHRIDRSTRVRPGESLVRRAARWALLVSVSYASAASVGMAVVGLMAEERYRLPSMLGLLLLLVVGSAVLTFAFFLLTHAMRQALFAPSGRSLPRAIAIGLLACVISAAASFVLYTAVSGDAAQGLELVRRVVAPVLPLIPAILVLATWQVEKERRYVREWAELQLD